MLPQTSKTGSSGAPPFTWATRHKGSRAIIEQTRVNDEVWLQRHVVVDVDFRLGLVKNFDFDVDITDRDYKKFRTDSRIVPLGEASAQQ